jgi:hypothetical protein
MTNDARSGFRKNPTPAAVLCVLATSARKGSNRLHDRSETPRRGRAPPFRCSWRLVEKYFLAAIRSPPAGPWPALVAAAEPFFPPSASCAIPEQPWPKRNVSLTRIPNTDGRAERGLALGFGVKACTRQSSRSPSAVSPISPPRKPPATHDAAARAATAYFQETKCFLRQTRSFLRPLRPAAENFSPS